MNLLQVQNGPKMGQKLERFRKMIYFDLKEPITFSNVAVKCYAKHFEPVSNYRRSIVGQILRHKLNISL